MNLASLLKPNVLSFGFAVILSINTTSVWGGVFPYFPAEAQNSVSTVSFYLVQLASLTISYLAVLFISWHRPHAIGRLGVLAPPFRFRQDRSSWFRPCIFPRTPCR